MVTSAKGLLKALYITCGVFVGLFVTYHIASTFYISHIADVQKRLFDAGIAHDINFLKLQGDEVAQNQQLASEILEGSHNGLVETLSHEREFRGVGLMGVTDANGIVLGRTLTKGKYGDNVFLTLPIGRIVAEGKSAESIELNSFVGQISMVTARPIVKDEKMIGALFASYLLNDAYAKRFKETYLENKGEVVFYTKNNGIYGSSFANADERKLIENYFNTGSEWIKNGITDKSVSMPNGRTYVVKNIVFQGLETSPGGAFLFVERSDLNNFISLTNAGITLLVFITLASYVHVRRRYEERGWRYYALLLFVSLPVFGLAFGLLYSRGLGFIKLSRIPYPLYNSAIRIEPEFSIYDKDFEQKLTVMVDTGDEEINVVQVKINFDPKSVRVVSLDKGASLCTYVVESIVDQNAGTLVHTCGIRGNISGKKSLPIVDIVVVPNKAGRFELAFDKLETKVLASDGLGTDVLRFAQNGSYRVDDFNLFGEVHGTTTEKARTFVVFSTTHPNESRWYNSSNAHFVWRGRPDAVYRYAFDTEEETIPTNVHIASGNQIDLDVPGDGVYYFHLQSTTGGPTAHYRIRSDMTPPTIASMNLSQKNIVKGDVVRFSFNAEDITSGVQQNYYVDLGSKLFLPVGQELYVPFLDSGDQKVTLRVYDGAGNFSERTQVLRVEDK